MHPSWMAFETLYSGLRSRGEVASTTSKEHKSGKYYPTGRHKLPGSVIHEYLQNDRDDDSSSTRALTL